MSGHQKWSEIKHRSKADPEQVAKIRSQMERELALVELERDFDVTLGVLVSDDVEEATDRLLSVAETRPELILGPVVGGNLATGALSLAFTLEVDWPAACYRQIADVVDLLTDHGFRVIAGSATRVFAGTAEAAAPPAGAYDAVDRIADVLYEHDAIRNATVALDERNGVIRIGFDVPASSAEEAMRAARDVLRVSDQAAPPEDD